MRRRELGEPAVMEVGLQASHAGQLVIRRCGAADGSLGGWAVLQKGPHLNPHRPGGNLLVMEGTGQHGSVHLVWLYAR
jgi:hypothetical protein